MRGPEVVAGPAEIELSGKGYQRADLIRLAPRFYQLAVTPALAARLGDHPQAAEHPAFAYLVPIPVEIVNVVI